MKIPPLRICSNSTGATIEHLPPELLGVIFTFVHEEIRGSTQDYEDSLTVSNVDDQEPKPELPLESAGIRGLMNEQRHQVVSLARLPGFFPYNCARTCTMWRDIMCSHPVFWTRLAFFTDSQQTSLKNAKEYIGLSKTLPLNVIITYRRDLVPSSDDDQKKLIDDFLELLMPHLFRLQMLHIDAFSSTSLPSFEFNDDVYYEAPLLTDLSFSCEQDRQNVPSDFTFPFLEDLAFSCKSLQSVSIDGLTLRKACLNSLHWLNYQDRIEQLTITESKFIFDDLGDRIPDPEAHRLPIITVLDFIDGLQTRLAYLKLSHLTFNLENVPNFLQHSYSLPQLNVLYLDDVPLPSTKQLFRLCDFPKLGILHLSNYTELDGSILDDMSIEVTALFLSLIDREADVAKFLRGWFGYGLCLIHCRWSSDGLLDKLATTLDLDEGELPPDGGKKFLCPNMSLLFLKMCPVFSVASVKNFIEARNHYVDYSDSEWQTKTTFGPAIRTLVIKNLLGVTRQTKGIKSGPLDEEDEQWFKERLVDFSWE